MLDSELHLNFIVETTKTSTVERTVIHNKNSRKNKIKFNRTDYLETSMKWTLFAYSHKVEDDSMNIEFFPMSSSKKLNNGLSASSVLKYLNSNLVFDFYEPKEKDKLTIRMEYKHSEINRKSRPFINDFISFIFDKEWTINEGFDHLNYSYKELKSGEMIRCY